MARTRRSGPAPPDPGARPSRRYTLRDIEQKVGVPNYLLQFWTNNRLLLPEGAIELLDEAARLPALKTAAEDSDPSQWRSLRAAAEHPGRGRARWFSAVEVQIASLLWPLSMGGLPIGYLRNHAAVFRRALTGDGPPQQRLVGGFILDYARVRQVLARAARGVGENFFIHCSAPDGRSILDVLTDEEGPPTLELKRFYPDGFGSAMLVVINLTERLAGLFADC